MQTSPNARSGMNARALVPFLALTFGLTWGIAVLIILFNDQILAIFGEIGTSNPLYTLAVYSPGIAGGSWFGDPTDGKAWRVPSGG